MPPTTPLDQLLELTLLLGDDMRRELGRHGLTESRTQLLWLLHHGGPTQQSRLASAMRVSARHVTGLVDALTDQALVLRRPHPTDRRATLVGLTDQGAAIMREMAKGYDELVDVLFGSMTPTDRQRFTADLDGVLDRLRARLAEEPS